MTASHEGATTPRGAAPASGEAGGDPSTKDPAGTGRREVLAERLARGGTRIHPVSAAQRGLWFEDQLRPGHTGYTVAWPLRLTGELDVDALRTALTALVTRQDVLRTRFVGVDGEPVQVVDPPAALPCPLTDLSRLPAQDLQERVRERIQAAAGRPFDLATGPLFTAELLRETGRHHVLLLAAHHIVFDGWSWSVLLRDLSTLYQEALGQVSVTGLPPLAVRYGDYADYEKELLTGEDGAFIADHVDYWRERLAGAPQSLDLPTDAEPGPAARTGRGARLPLTVPPETSAALLRLCAEEGATPFMGVLAATSLVLGRYADTSDVVVGTLAANRSQPELEDLVGLFVNALPLRVDLSGAPGFRELLGRCRQTALGAFTHQELPFERLVEELAPRRVPGTTPYVRVSLAMQNGPEEPDTLGDLTVESLPTGITTATFDLSLQLWPASGGGLEGFVEYATDLFTEDTAKRFTGHVRQVLTGAVTDPERPVTDLALLTDAEAREALVEGGAPRALPAAPGEAGPVQDPPATRPHEALLHELVAAQAARTPDATAVSCGEDRLSYAELDRAAGRVAATLRARGVRPEDLVGVCVRRSVWSVTALLGVLKAGAAYLPLEPDNPEDRLAYLLADSGARTVLVQSDLRGRLPADGLRVIPLDEAVEQAPQEADSFTTSAPGHADQLAYVIYTSGSTGRPKGVAVSHRAAVTRVFEPRYVSLGPHDVMLHALALSFDVSVLEVFGALTNGCRLAVLPDKALPERVGAFLVDEGVTVGWLTAALFHAVVDVAGTGLGGMRSVIAGGDQLSTSHVERALELLDDNALLINGYGPSEATVFASTHPMRPRDEVSGRVPIGGTIPDTELLVLDAHGQLVPPGVPGELYIGGDCLARGYLGRPDLTAERFLPHPYAGDGARLYRTGDLVRRRTDGRLEFLGRTDHQVKVRGFRVELGEIEQVLRRHPAVGDAVVVALADDRAERALVGYVERLAGTAVSVAELTAHCRAALPGYMVPPRLVVLDALPLNPNGKVDRAALPDIDGQRPELATGYVPPRGPLEEAVAGVWREVLGLDRVGAHDDFFDLGGHSLLASRLLARLRRSLERDVSLAAFFAGPTVAGLAATLADERTAAAPLRPALVPVDRPDPLPVSLGQRRLWFAHQLEPDSVDYTIVWPLRLLGPLDEEALRRALNAVVARHEPLRTRFETVAGQPVQRVDPPGELPCPRLDLEHLPTQKRAAAVTERIEAAVAHRFDLAADTLFQVRLLRLSAEEHVLLVVVHHLVFDGWSTSVLLRDLSALYDQERAGADLTAAGPSPLPVGYGDYTVWERSWLTGEALEAQLAFWRAHLGGAPQSTRLPADFVPEGPGRSGAGARHRTALPGGSGRALAEFCARAGATPFMGVLAALGVVLGRYGETEDVVVGTYSANRSQPELEELVGFFVNTLALRVDLSGDPGFGELVTRCRTAALGAFAHQDVPFDRVVEELSPSRRAGETPYMRVALVMQNLPEEEPTFGDLRAEQLPTDTRWATYDLSLHLWPTADGGFDGFVEYATDLFGEPTAARFAGHVRRVLEQGLGQPERPVAEFDMLSPAERHTLLDGTGVWGPAVGADHEAPAQPPAHAEGPAARFLRQAAHTPGAVAFQTAGATLTYAELERTSKALALQLREAGVGEETPVGVCLPRGLELPVAALAVWRAGGAYLPLDPEAPSARIAHLIADSGTPLLLTDEQHAAALPSAPPRLVLDAAGHHAPFAADTGTSTGEDLPELEGATDASALAAVIYTSGSTGVPKGVAISAGSLLNRVDWLAATWQVGPGEVLCQKGPIGFVDGLWELLGGLLYGAPTVVAEPDTASDPRALVALLSEHRVSRLLAVPSLLHALLEVPGLAERTPALTRWVSSGEELPPRLAALFQERLPGRELCNLYGSSEAWDALCQRTGGEAVAGRPIPVGDPISGVRAYVLDAWLRPVPVGVPGDLYLGGACLARGYLGRPEFTAERFLPDPFGRPGGLLYRSGDRAVRRADGQLELAGRTDFQLKIRGVRVEPTEVERALEQLPGIRRATVTGWRRPGAQGTGTELVAYVVPHPGWAVDERGVRAELSRVLPQAMVPTLVTSLEELPLNPSGKVDRAALPEPRAGSGDRPDTPEVTEEWTERESALRAIWVELLGVDSVGPHEDFFDLGGHSLLAMQLADRVTESFGVELGVRAVFENPTIHLLSRVVPAPSSPDLPRGAR